MLIKKLLIAAICSAAVIGFSQNRTGNLKPMTDREFAEYEYRYNNNTLDPRKPVLPEDYYKSVLNEIVEKFLSAKVPKTVKEYRKLGTSELPSRNKILGSARKLKQLTDNPELQEVSGYQLAWFRKVGNALIKLERYQKRMVDAVIGNNEKAYQQLYYFYCLDIADLKKLLENPEKLSLRDRRIIANKNTAERRKVYDLMKQRYLLTLDSRKKAGGGKNTPPNRTQNRR